MKAKEFFELVSMMRAAQRDYFKGRLTSDLNRAKELERRVDNEINRVEAILGKGNAPELF